MKKKIKKIIFLIVCICIILLFLILRFKSHSYETSYVINKYKVIENYNDINKEYKFFIKINNIIFPYNIKSSFVKRRELIEKIEVYNDEKELCVLPKSDEINFYPICFSNNEYNFYNLSNIKINEFNYKKIINEEVNNENIKVNYTNNSNYLLYNYKGFFHIDNNEIKNIKLFKNDVYTLELLYQFDEYLIVPNYNEKYYFSKFFIINIKNGKSNEINFDEEISFNSKFLGEYKNKIYLLDLKEEKEYILDIKKGKIKETEFIILKNNKLEKTTYKKIINNNLSFDNKEKDRYKLKDDKLYQIIDNYKILITDKNVNKIIKQEDNTIYYLVKDDLYMFNNEYGEVFLIKNFEWNFNNTNMIYLYK